MKFIWNLGVRRKQSERGVMLAVAALGFTSFLMAAGMAVDISNFYTAGTELQNAADASALAGATMLNSTVAGIDAAVARATAVANTFQFNVANVSIPANNVRFAANLSQFDGAGTDWDAATAKSATNFAKVRFVQVKIAPTNVKVYLAGIALGSGSVTFNRTAVAGQSASGTTAPGTSNDPALTSVSNPSRLVLVEDDVSGGTLSTSGACGNSTVYTKGCTYNINMTPPCDALASYYELADGNYGAAGNDRNKQMISGLNGCFCKNSELAIWAHPVASSIANGLNTLFNVYSASGIPSTLANEFPPDANVKENITYDQYKAGNSVTAPTGRSGVPGRRIFVMGITKKSSVWFDPADPTYETGKMNSYKYGTFFLKKKVSTSGQIQMEYIGDRVTVGSGNTCAACPVGTLSDAETRTFSSGIAVPVLYR